MNIGFLIVGGIIFAIYIGLTIWNIVYSNRKQQEENYPNWDVNKPTEESKKPTEDDKVL